MAATGWMAWRHLGPYRWLAEAQSRVLGGSYYPAINWIVLFLVMALPLMAAARLVPFGQDIEFTRLLAYTTRYPRHFQLVALSVMGLLVGGWLLIDARLAGPLVATPLAAVETGEETARYLELTEFEPDLDEILELSRDRIYVPLRSLRGGPIVVLAKVDTEELEELATTATCRGLLEADGLPNEVRIVYEDAGLLADPHYVVAVGESPESKQRFALVLLGVASILSLLTAAYYAAAIRGNV